MTDWSAIEEGMAYARQFGSPATEPTCAEIKAEGGPDFMRDECPWFHTGYDMAIAYARQSAGPMI
ncbi:MAG: hypothetical protein AAGF71_04150 [Pseudomonadota bacterium]